MPVPWYTGNAQDDGRARRGWVLGYFLDPTIDGLRATGDVEIKWGVHPAGDKRDEWTVGDQRTTVLILVEGEFRLQLSDSDITLAKQGDYVVWGPGTDHIWEAVKDSVVMTVRWPSTP